MIAFGQALPRIRGAGRRRSGRPGLPREKVLATVVRLLETTFIRVGNEEYARANGSFGLTTLQDRHVDVEGIAGALPTSAARAASSTRSTSATAGSRASCGAAATCPARSCSSTSTRTGEPATIDSADVNAYLHEIAGEEFTAKDFRTWAGSVLALRPFASCERPTRGTRHKSRRRPRRRTGRGAARQHARRLPQELHPPRSHRWFPRRRAGRAPRARRRPDRRPGPGGERAARPPAPAPGRGETRHPPHPPAPPLATPGQVSDRPSSCRRSPSISSGTSAAIAIRCSPGCAGRSRLHERQQRGPRRRLGHRRRVALGLGARRARACAKRSRT